MNWQGHYNKRLTFSELLRKKSHFQRVFDNNYDNKDEESITKRTRAWRSIQKIETEIQQRREVFASNPPKPFDPSKLGHRVFHTELPPPPRKPIVHALDWDIYNILSEKGSRMTRWHIMAAMKNKIPRTTVYDSLKRLIIGRYVRRISEKRKRRGRPKIFFKVIPQ